MSELHITAAPVDFVYVVDSEGYVIKSYPYDLVIENGLPCYLWPEGSQIIHKPNLDRYLYREAFVPVGDIVNV